MNLRDWLNRRFRVLFRRRDVESELSDEIQLHLDMEAEELARQGRTRAEARREARILLGGVEQTKQAVRDARPLYWVDGIELDLRLALRMLRKSWGLTLVGGFSMVVVIAICTTVFVFLDAVGGGMLPLDEGERIVDLRTRDRLTGRVSTSVRDFEHWRQSMSSVEDIAAFRTVESDLTADSGRTGGMSVAEMTPSGFRVARVSPALGRPLVDEDARVGADRVVVIGYDAWQSRLAGDPGAVGSSVQLGGVEHIVIGIMPDDFAFPVNHGAWVALQANALDARSERVRVFGRLAPGATIETAEAELSSVGPAPSDAREEPGPQLLTQLGPYARMGGFSSSALGVVQLLFALLLIPPCANIAILIYARNLTRAEEFAVRAALGARRRRIVGQLLVESLVLTAFAGGVALLVTHRFLEWVRQLMAQDPEFGRGIPYWIWMQLDLSFESVIYVAGLVLVAGVITGTVPAFRATGQIAQGLGGRKGGPRLSRTWTALVVTQITLSMAILPIAASTVWAPLKEAVLGPGFAAEEYFTAQLVLDEERSPARVRELQTELVRELEAETGVLGVTLSSAAPEAEEPLSVVETDLAGQAPFVVASNDVDSAFFNVFDTQLQTGRAFTPADMDSGLPNVIVTRRFAVMLGEGVNPVGVRVRRVGTPDSEPGPWFEIVGVVDDISASKTLPTIYRPLQPASNRAAVTLVLRTAPTIPSDLAAQLPVVATTVDPALRVDRLRRLDAVYWQTNWEEYGSALAQTFVVVLVLLSSIAGVHTVAAFAVAQRRREIAIRVAIGAQSRRLLAQIFGRTLRSGMAGASIGVLLALYIDRYLENDTSVMGLIASAAFVIAIVLFAVTGPARRTLRVEATETLREI